MHASGDADAAGFGGGLQTRGNVYAVAHEIGALKHYVAEIDADAEADLAIGRQLVVEGAQGGLDVGGATHGFHGTVKFGEDRVAGGIEDAAAMHGDERFKNLLVAAKGVQRSFFVFAHEAAEFGDVGGENGSEFAFQ